MDYGYRIKKNGYSDLSGYSLHRSGDGDSRRGSSAAIEGLNREQVMIEDKYRRLSSENFIMLKRYFSNAIYIVDIFVHCITQVVDLLVGERH